MSNLDEPQPYAETGWFFPPADEDALPEGLSRLFAKSRERLGFVPNVFRAYAHRPERFSAWFGHYKQLHQPTENLSAADREMVAVVVSQANGCLYCLVAHGASLREEMIADGSGDAVTGDRVAFDWRRAGLSRRRQRICAYAEKVTVRPVECDAADLDGLRETGLSDDEIWDVVELAAMYNFTNRMSMATGMLANREYHALGRP